MTRTGRPAAVRPLPAPVTFDSGGSRVEGVVLRDEGAAAGTRRTNSAPSTPRVMRPFARLRLPAPTSMRSGLVVTALA